MARNPLCATHGQMLALGDQTLVDGAGQQGDAVPADLIAEVLAVFWRSMAKRAKVRIQNQVELDKV